MKTDEFGIIGKTLEEADAILTEKGITYRFSCINGKHQMMTCDYEPERVNLETKDGLIDGYRKG